MSRRDRFFVPSFPYPFEDIFICCKGEVIHSPDNFSSVSHLPSGFRRSESCLQRNFRCNVRPIGMSEKLTLTFIASEFLLHVNRTSNLLLLIGSPYLWKVHQIVKSQNTSVAEAGNRGDLLTLAATLVLAFALVLVSVTL